MKEQIIEVEPFDDVASVRDKLRWARADHVLLVLADGAEHRIARNKLDLLLLQREASRQGAALALITRDRVIIDFARELDLPCFASVEANRARRWAAPPPRRVIEQPEPGDRLSADLVEAGTRLRAPQPMLPASLQRALTRGRWALAAGGVLLGGLLLVPGASIHLEPITNQVTVTTPVIADPHASGIDTSAGTIPARMVGVDVDATTSTDTTGTHNIPTEKAHGTVLLTNLIPDQITVPAGTFVRTSAAQPVKFATVSDVTLPGRVGQNVEVGVEAVEPGFSGNLQSNKINVVDGQLGTRVAVTNPDPTQGGSDKPTRAVSRQDYDRVRTLAIQQLQQRAYAEMQTDPYIKLLDTEFIPVESLAVVLINAETYSASVGETASSISLTMRATVQGTAIDERAARQVVYSKMTEKVGPGFEISPDTLVFKKGEVTALGSERRITFVMEGGGDVVAAINPDDVRRMIAGMPVRQAQDRLQRDLQLASPPTLSVWPAFWPLMPILPSRIDVTSQTR